MLKTLVISQGGELRRKMQGCDEFGTQSIEFCASRHIGEVDDWDMRAWGGGWEAVVGAVGVHNGGDNRIEVGGGIAQDVDRGFS